MKINNCFLVAAVTAAAFALQPSAVAQGSLTPPGAPAPTMKTADQIEPRTLVNAVNTPGDSQNLFIISNSGSYYLATNLVGVSGKNGIKIACNNVTLDLAGFCLTGANSLDAVLANVRTNIILRNGNISGWGNVGVDEYASANSIVEHINVTSCSRGIWIGKGVVRDCNCQNNGDTGIECTGGNITGCTASNNGHGNAVATPPELSLYGSYLYDSSGSGIYITLGTVSGCTAQNNGYAGITANGQSTVSGCNVANNYIAGIVLKNNGNQVLENNLQSNDAAGAPGISYDSFINSFHAGEILLFGSNSRIEGNHITGNGLGAIFLLGNYSTVIKNSLINTGFIMSGAHNVLGSVINDSTGAITNASPWGNIVL